MCTKSYIQLCTGTGLSHLFGRRGHWGKGCLSFAHATNVGNNAMIPVEMWQMRMWRMEKQSKNKIKAKQKQNRRTFIFLGEGARFRQHWHRTLHCSAVRAWTSLKINGARDEVIALKEHSQKRIKNYILSLPRSHACHAVLSPFWAVTKTREATSMSSTPAFPTAATVSKVPFGLLLWSKLLLTVG